jgi:hypothetical protein
MRLPAPNLLPLIGPRVRPVDRRIVRLEQPPVPPVARRAPLPVVPLLGPIALPDQPARPKVRGPVAVVKAPERAAPAKRPAMLDRPPPLPTLDAAVSRAALQPSLATQRRRGDRGRPPALLPDQVAQVPALAPLPDAPLMRGLLPPGADVGGGTERPPAVTLALAPPALPPLTDQSTR